MRIDQVANEDELVEEHLPLARCLARRAVQRSGNVLDEFEAHSAALLGLLRAVRTFKDDGAASLRTYAALLIRHAIADALRFAGPVPRHMYRKGVRPPAQLLDELTPLLRACVTLPDTSTDDRDEIDCLIRRIPGGRRREMFTLYYLEQLTCADIARRYGISQSRVSQLLADARRAIAPERVAELGRSYNRTAS